MAKKNDIIIERQYIELNDPKEVKKAEDNTVEAFLMLAKLIRRSKEKLVS